MVGDPSRKIVGPAAPEHAAADDVVAVSGTAWLAVAKASPAGTVVLRTQDLEAYGDAQDKTLILVDDAPLRRTLELFAPEEDLPAPGVHPSAVVDPSATVGNDVCIGPFVHVGPGASLGEGVVLESGVQVGARGTIGARSRLRRHAILGRDCVVGQDCTLHEHAVVGGEGFGFDYAPGQPAQRLPHLGAVCIGDRFELGVQSCVDRGLLTNTTIGHDVKIDNLCQVGHNAKVGDRVRMSGMSGVAGSSVLEDDVVLAGAAIVKDHVTVHQGATIGMDSCVISDVPAGEVWSGSPARPHRQFLRSVALINRLARSKPGHSS